MRKTFLGWAALALLAGCGEEGGRGGLTADESRRLDEAARMLDEGNAATDVAPANAN
jgi:hypothetical protein